MHSGKNAHLEIKLEAAKPIVQLTAEVDVQRQQHHTQPRDGSACHHRSKKGAAEFDAAVNGNVVGAEASAQKVDSFASVKVAEGITAANVSRI